MAGKSTHDLGTIIVPLKNPFTRRSAAGPYVSMEEFMRLQHEFGDLQDRANQVEQKVAWLENTWNFWASLPSVGVIREHQGPEAGGEDDRHQGRQGVAHKASH